MQLIHCRPATLTIIVLQMYVTGHGGPVVTFLTVVYKMPSSPLAVCVFVTKTTAIYSLAHGLCHRYVSLLIQIPYYLFESNVKMSLPLTYLQKFLLKCFMDGLWL